MNTTSSHNNHKQFQIDKLVDSWRHLSPEVIGRLPQGILAKMSEQQQRSGKSHVAESRIDDLETTAKPQPSNSAKNSY
jgi:hypothetical protein